MGDAITVKFTTNGSGNNGVTLVYTCAMALTDAYGMTEPLAVNWPITIGPTPYTAGAETTFTTPALPGYILKHLLWLSFVTQPGFSVDGALGQNAFQQIVTPIYAVLSAPTDPMTVPWIEVLDDSCSWAAYDSVAADAARDETLGLFFAQRFYYPGDSASHWTDALGAFKLTQFVASVGYVPGNCVDVSDFLTIADASVGLAFPDIRVLSNPSNPDGRFVTNSICPIGSDPTVDENEYGQLTYQPFTWGWHQVARSPTQTIYDACAAQKTDLSGNWYRNPAFNWPLAGYWQTAGPTPPYGLVDTPDPCAADIFYGPYVPDVY